MTEEEKQQELVIIKRRQSSLFWLGVFVLLLWAIPHPNEGFYWFKKANVVTTGSFEGITRLRWWISVGAWAAAIDYIVKPFMVRWRWRKGNQQG